MKLSRIPGIEPSVKQSYSFKLSTVEALNHYKDACESAAGVDVGLRDLVEQILIDFMSSDRTFQRYLRDLEAKKKKEEERLAKEAKEAKKASEKEATAKQVEVEKASKTETKEDTKTSQASTSSIASPPATSATSATTASSGTTHDSTRAPTPARFGGSFGS